MKHINAIKKDTVYQGMNVDILDLWTRKNGFKTVSKNKINNNE